MLSPPFLTGSTFLHSILKVKKLSAKTTLPKAVLAGIEAWPLLHGLQYVIESMAGNRLHAKTQWMTGYRIRAAMQVMNCA